MDIASLHRHVKASHLPLEKLAGNTQLNEAGKVAEVSRQFEAVLLRHILSNAEKSASSSKGKPPSASSGIYQDMVTNEMADQISRSGAFGLARSLQHQLGRELKEPTALTDPVGIGTASNQVGHTL